MPGHKTGQALRSALSGRPKLLLTATPLQNDLMELFGLVSLLDEQILGPEHAFRSRYRLEAETGGLQTDAVNELKERLAPVVQRTLRRQVREYVRYTNRRSIVEDFAPSPEEQDLYEKVSEYLQRSEAAAIEPGKKTLLTLVLPQAAGLLHVRHRAHAAEAVGQPRASAWRRRSWASRPWRSSSPKRPSSTSRRARSGPTTRPSPSASARSRTSCGS